MIQYTPALTITAKNKLASSLKPTHRVGLGVALLPNRPAQYLKEFLKAWHTQYLKLSLLAYYDTTTTII